MVASMPQPFRHLKALLILPLLLALAPAEAADPRRDLKAVRGKIEKLEKDIAAAEESKADVTDQLKQAEQQISTTRRTLHKLSRDRQKIGNRLAQLASQSRRLGADIAEQQAALAALVRQRYQSPGDDSLRLLLSGTPPAEVSRQLHYLGRIAQQRSALIRDLHDNLARKQSLAQETEAQADALLSVEQQEREAHKTLLSQQQTRQKALGRLSQDIGKRRKEVDVLRADAKRLSALIARLSRPKKRATPGGRAIARNTQVPDASLSGTAFAKLKGRLRLPVRGELLNRFGRPRPEGGGTWKGVFIRTTDASEVLSIADGTVVFADWLRGFGNLLIIDHGEDFMSVYGNNASLLRQTGDKIRSGDAVSLAGQSGGSGETGLYFELRYQGNPLDPARWVSLR